MGYVLFGWNIAKAFLLNFDQNIVQHNSYEYNLSGVKFVSSLKDYVPLCEN